MHFIAYFSSSQQSSKGDLATSSILWQLSLLVHHKPVAMEKMPMKSHFRGFKLHQVRFVYINPQKFQRDILSDEEVSESL